MDFLESTIKTYSGLSSEIKPTIAAGNNVPNGSRWREVDTGRKFHFNLSDDSWHLKENIQYPIPIDGDSVYVKDVDISNSDNGGFSGDVIDYFDSLKSINSDASATNPKIIKIWFNRTIQTNSIGLGCDDFTKSFSNIKIKALGSGEEVRYTKDLSTDDTKRNSYLVQMPPLALNGVIVEFYTVDEVCLSNLIIFKSIDVNSRLKAVSSLTGEVENISSYREVLNINSAWVHRKIVNETFFRKTGVQSDLAIAAFAGDTIVTVVDGSVFTVGHETKACNGSLQEIGLLSITVINVNAITLDRPITNDYPIGTPVCEVTSNMAVTGTLAAPVSFKIAPPDLTVWQITRYLLSIVDNSTMDDGLFGSLPSLTNGVTLRATTTAGRTVSFGNWKNNGDIKLDMYDVEYSDKAPAGEYGLRGRWTFTKAEVISEIDGSDPLQNMEILIQDDLSDLTSFKMRAQGRVFSP
jgi:hypothetical protein